MKYALKFGYNGKNYSGYARQPNLKTIEGEIFIALLESTMVNDPRAFKIGIASRTDKGVSALGNVLSFSTDFREGGILSALNANLDDIWFYALTKVPDHFNPRHAKRRWYRYHIFSDDLDLDNLKKTSDIFVGTHNFRNFAKLEGNDPTIAIDSIDVSKREDVILIDIKAQRFLWHLVRRMVNAILNVEAKKISPDDLEHALHSQGKVDLGLALPEPLVLMDVEYDFDFAIEPDRIKNLPDILLKKLRDIQMNSLLYKKMLNIVK